MPKSPKSNPPSKKAPKQKGKGSRKKSRVESYRTYIIKILKQIHPELGISKRSISTLNSFVQDIFDRLANEALRLTRYQKRTTLSSRDIQTAVRLSLPGDLAKHAVHEGTKAVTIFSNSSGHPPNKKKSRRPTSYSGSVEPPTTVNKQTNADNKKKSRTQRAGLHFPVGRVLRHLKNLRTTRVSPYAGVYLTAVLEYLVAENLELAGNAAKDIKKKLIINRHLQLAIRADEELNKLLGSVTIAAGGVLPYINKVLLPVKKVKKTSKKTTTETPKPKDATGNSSYETVNYFSSWF